MLEITDLKAFLVRISAALTLVIALCLGGCDKDEDYSSSNACSKNNTANIEIANDSQYTTYYINFDGNVIGSLHPSETFDRTVSAGSHFVGFYFSSTSQLACVENPVLEACSERRFSCDDEFDD